MLDKYIKLDFCLRFNYPQEIKSMLEEIVDVLIQCNGVLSIISLGSLPRGELSFRMRNGTLELFSDIELVVVTERTISREEQIVLLKNLKSLRKKIQIASPLFDIAVDFFSLQEFKKLPYKVRFYELKESGEVLFGEDIRYMIPKVNINNRNMQDTNNIIFERLFSMLIHFPSELFEDKKMDLAHDVFKYIVARNALDIATVLLFQKGIFLPTYREKIEYIVSNSNRFTNDFGSNFPHFLLGCLKVKLDMDFRRPLLSLFEDTLKYFKLLLVHTLINNGVNVEKGESLSILIKRTKKDIFGESDITSTKLWFILDSSGLNMLLKRLKSLSYSFWGCSIFFLLSINDALCLYLKSDRRCLSVLDDSWWSLMRLGVLSGKEPIPVDFVNRFLYLKEKFFLDFYIKFLNPGATEHIEEILGWRYE